MARLRWTSLSRRPSSTRNQDLRSTLGEAQYVLRLPQTRSQRHLHLGSLPLLLAKRLNLQALGKQHNLRHSDSQLRYLPLAK